MYFKKLEIFGFKSFADKTVLNFEPGITAVVGPNGCGKSNIFDAIRWVLGEQSVKELRGSAMEDVIFNGTASKPPLGFAEVSLTFANDSRVLNIEYDEVTITRRLFRSGESEYLLNKTVVRLKDIQELLMGTGIGAEAYSLIQQGKVDLVVSARPEDRRMIFDEASGITKYKAKKREALNKLKDTENNLLRINDITLEVKRQIASIERQANKARKYKAEFEQLKNMEVKLAKCQIELFGEREEKIRAGIETMRAKEAQFNQEIEEISGLLADEINYLGDLEQKINEARSEAIKLDGQIDLNNRQVGFNQERVETLNRNEKKLVVQKEELIERCRQQQEKIEGLKEVISVTEETLQYNEQRLNENREHLKRLEKTIAEARDKIRGHEEKMLILTSSQVSVRNELTDIMKETQGGLARKRRLEVENEKVLCEKKEVDQKLEMVDGQMNNVLEIVASLKTEQTSRLQQAEESKSWLSQLGGQITQLENKSLSMKSQKEFIEKLHAQYQDISDPIVEGRIITQTPPLEHHTGILGKVKQVSIVNADDFGQLKQRIGEPQAQQLYEIVCETKFIELDPQQISKRIEEVGLEVGTLVCQKETLEQKLRDQRVSLEEIDREIRNQEKKLSVLESQKKDVLAEVGKLSEELALVSSELREVTEALARFHKKEEELNYRLDTVSQDIGWCQNDVKEKQAQIAVQLQAKEEILVTIAQLETEIESSKDKSKSEREHQALFAQDLDKSLEEIKRIDDELTEQADKKEKYGQETVVLRAAIEQIQVSKGALQAALRDYETQKEDIAQRVNSSRAQMMSMEQEIDRIKQELHGQELENQKLGFNAQDIKNRLFQTYKIDFDQAVLQEQSVTVQASVEGQPLPSDKLMSIEDLTAELETLRKRCEAFGSVNLVAIEEYEEMKERFEFLTKQQSDLLEAKSQLMSTINKINRSTREMFMETFEKVSAEFQIYFRTLFGGGEANLVLLDPDNVLESGIEIVAKPPGKKLQNISLLSGGEKTLTAIALIFGVFKVNPSPFCVLDEIDAALDESNVGRFSYLLKEFAKIAQFIVITHNKKTIANADVMYGITMPETGISRIVSVKFSDDKVKQEELVGV
jgi:chromosome segregation protein